MRINAYHSQSNGMIEDLVWKQSLVILYVLIPKAGHHLNRFIHPDYNWFPMHTMELVLLLFTLIYWQQTMFSSDTILIAHIFNARIMDLMKWTISFDIKRGEKTETISIARLKPANLSIENPPPLAIPPRRGRPHHEQHPVKYTNGNNHVNIPTANIPPVNTRHKNITPGNTSVPRRTTRTGRTVNIPIHFKDSIMSALGGYVAFILHTFTNIIYIY